MPTQPKYTRVLPLAALLALLATGPTSSAAGAPAKGNQVGEGYVFPLPSKHTYGDGFGAGRGHDGQDVFADCGRKLVAAHDGKVQLTQYDGSGYGNMLVLDSKGTDVDLLYAHMRKPATVNVGEEVTAGEKVGEVGQTGNATGCHLHFEMESAPGYGGGGHPMRSVTRYLKEWDSYS